MKEHTEIRFKKMSKLIKSVLKPKDNVLDIGCNRHTSKYATHGVDIRKTKTSLIFTRFDLEKGLPYEDSFFDIIIAGEIIEHLKNEKLFLNEVTRCLKKKGYLILSTPNVMSLQKRILFILGILSWDLNCEQHIRFNSFKSISEKLENRGFKIERKITNNIPYPLKLKLFRNLAIRLGDYFYSLGNQIIFISRKGELNTS